MEESKNLAEAAEKKKFSELLRKRDASLAIVRATRLSTAETRGQKDALIAERESKRKKKRERGDDERRGRKQSRERDERSDSRRNSRDEFGRSRSYSRSRSRDRSDDKKSKNKSNPRRRDSWMNSDGEDLGSSDESMSNMARYEEWVEGKPVAFQAQFRIHEDLACIDSGTNRLILKDSQGWDSYG